MLIWAQRFHQYALDLLLYLWVHAHLTKEVLLAGRKHSVIERDVRVALLTGPRGLCKLAQLDDDMVHDLLLLRIDQKKRC